VDKSYDYLTQHALVKKMIPQLAGEQETMDLGNVHVTQLKYAMDTFSAKTLTSEKTPKQAIARTWIYEELVRVMLGQSCSRYAWNDPLTFAKGKTLDMFADGGVDRDWQRRQKVYREALKNSMGPALNQAKRDIEKEVREEARRKAIALKKELKRKKDEEKAKTSNAGGSSSDKAGK